MSDPHPSVRIAVVGAGATGVATLYELFDRFSGALPQVTLIEGSGVLGIGNVFAPDLDCALVNRQAKPESVVGPVI